MPAPLAKGLIIAASVLVAAGIAIYESPQVRQWVDQSRRKIAVALHSLGDEIQPRRPSESFDEYECRRTRREELIRRNRNELIRRAREEGIAVDLDELIRIGTEDEEVAEQRQRRRTNASKKSFDDLVGSDGMLKTDDQTSARAATGADVSIGVARKRGTASFAAGSAAAAASNPFTDDHLFFDQDDEEAPSPKPFTYNESSSRRSSGTLQHEADTPATADLIDLTGGHTEVDRNDHLPDYTPEADSDDADPIAQSFYSFASADSRQNLISRANAEPDTEPAEYLSTGTLTPRSEHSAFTGASMVGSHADDIAVLSMTNDSDRDALSDAHSEAGFTEGGFSDIGDEGLRSGIMTPSSWTDVGSDDGQSEWGGVGQGGTGHVSQLHP